jgi:hypothetical protein
MSLILGLYRKFNPEKKAKASKQKAQQLREPGGRALEINPSLTKERGLLNLL